MRMGIGLGVGINRSNYAQGIFNAYSARVVADGGVVESGTCVDAVSGILLNASLLLIPSGYKANKLYSEIPTNGNGDFTWARTSTANRTNSSSLLESMATGVPRLSYMYGSCPSVLLEPQRTNDFIQSENLFTTHLVQNLTTSGNINVETSPDGTQNADKFVPNTTSGVHGIANGSSLAITSGQAYTFSAFVKADGGAYNLISLTFDSGTAWGATKNCIFNASTGVSYSVPSGATMSSQNVGNGWYRIRATLTASGSVSASLYQYRIYIADSSGNLSFSASSGNTAGIYVWGAQLEAGAYPTTYIPTTSATATRIADSFSRSNIYTNGLISASGGTWFVSLVNNIVYARDTFTLGLYISDTSNISSNNINIRTGGTARLAINKVIAGISTALYLTTTDTTKLAIKWNGTTADIFANGTKVVSATAFTPTNMEFLRGDTTQVPVFIQQMALFSTPLSDTDCTTITTL